MQIASKISHSTTGRYGVRTEAQALKIGDTSLDAPAHWLVHKPRTPKETELFFRAGAGTTVAETLLLEWHPDEVRRSMSLPIALSVLAKLRSRALAFEIGFLYPADKPYNVEKTLIELGLLVECVEPPRILEGMVRRGGPMLKWVGQLDDATNRERSLPSKLKRCLGKLISALPTCNDVLFDMVWTLLHPAPVGGARLADYAMEAVDAGAPDDLLCRDDHVLSTAERYEALMRIALDPSRGRPLALRCALIELRYAELTVRLADYATCLAAIRDITAFAVRDSIFQALTGTEASGRSAAAAWQFDPRHSRRRAGLRNIDDYMGAVFARVKLSQLATRAHDDYADRLRAEGLDLSQWPAQAWLRDGRIGRRTPKTDRQPDLFEPPLQ